MNLVKEQEDPIGLLANLMDEYNLTEGELSLDGTTIKFAKFVNRPVMVNATGTGTASSESEEVFEEVEESESTPVVSGTPLNSPMTGIFYSSSSPGGAPFVKVGSQIEPGDVVGLIEAMKVFNEVLATEAGTVLRIVTETSKVVNAGDPILFFS